MFRQIVLSLQLLTQCRYGVKAPMAVANRAKGGGWKYTKSFHPLAGPHHFNVVFMLALVNDISVQTPRLMLCQHFAAFSTVYRFADKRHAPLSILRRFNVASILRRPSQYVAGQ